MGIDFDSNNPVVRDLTLADTKDGHQFGQPYFDSKTIRIDDQDDVTILLRARATKRPVSFRLRVDYKTGDHTLSTTIDDNGKSFSLTALNCVKGELDYNAFYSLGGQPTFGAYPKPPGGDRSC